jgi:hypothetical protein
VRLVCGSCCSRVLGATRRARCHTAKLPLASLARPTRRGSSADFFYCRRAGSLDPEIFGRHFATVRDFLVSDNLPFVKTAEAGLLYCRDMDEDVLAAAAPRLNKSIALCGLNHFTVPVAIVAAKRSPTNAPATRRDHRAGRRPEFWRLSSEGPTWGRGSNNAKASNGPTNPYHRPPMRFKFTERQQRSQNQALRALH